MNEQIKITATSVAWATCGRTLERMLRQLKEGDNQEAVNEMSFSNYEMDGGSHPWIRVGEAEITVTLHAQDEMVASQLRGLQAELNHARAEWLTKQSAIMDRISKLQALTNEVEA